ncbi:hypothetical protein A2810_00915 [candidate division Kazan bacterium RIFCSPHIGHO2_01_FULL_49_10]|uniref:Uncharacterized protein n=1 Tax=candidate division Kazan bacterium RIFCSPLOWO2_01_FULL_48_13 TaxID=1798539 RepID=A0A1F4PNY5_UNCK3|nr:MAG: hypothetical protein A2810_00915 [candidate division Kazan bacterium RIFCSPHIGHO2_01_FULL_49_10]OGB85397.1 MAG: hypothetical protein A2994_02110 [candidate division Kazan bacterium RIFCSPLOWO2_01_FULL_48_13]
MGLTPIKEVGRFLTWFFAVVPAKIFAHTKSLLLTAEDIFQFGANLRLWLAIEPLFGDYNWRGRLIGFIFRGFRVLATLIVYLVILLIGLVAALLWWMLPWLIFTMIK